jgi:hypothetical protein
MSYDLIGLRVPPGMTVEEFHEDEERELDDRPPTDEERAAMERLAQAVAEVDPRAERFDGDDFVEFTRDAIQVSLYARESGITIPYWFDGKQADAMLERAMAYARVLAQQGGYTVYDPQTGEVVETGDIGAARGAYKGGRRIVRDLEGRPQRRRWWRRR